MEAVDVCLQTSFQKAVAAAQLVDRRPGIHKALGSISKLYKSGIVALTWNPSPWGWRVGKSRVRSSRPGRFCLRRK